jgi:HEAT repeat protein
VTEIPGPALVDGLAHPAETVRDRCQELVALRGAAAEPLLALALSSKAAEARRRALVLLTHTPVVALAAPIKLRVDDSEEAVRAVALEAYAKLRRADALRVCVDSLQSDLSLLVQHSAAQQIGGLADLHGVDPLLDHLKLCDDRGVRIVIFAALRKISGKSFGRDEEAWRAWWTNHRDEILPEEDR